MSDELKQIFFNIGSWIAGILSAYILQHARPKQVSEDEHDKHQVETIEIQGRTLADAWKRIEALEKRDTEKQEMIDGLRIELEKFRRAYNRALRFIHENVSPTIPVPDFFMDTGELKRNREVRHIE